MISIKTYLMILNKIIIIFISVIIYYSKLLRFIEYWWPEIFDEFSGNIEVVKNKTFLSTPTYSA